MDTSKTILELARQALCWDHGIPYDAYCDLNQLTKQHCGLNLADYTDATWDDDADCYAVFVPEKKKDAFEEHIGLLTGFDTEWVVDYGDTVKECLEKNGGYLEAHESANHAVTLALLESQGKPGMAMYPDAYPEGTWALVQMSILSHECNVFLGTQKEVEERLNGTRPEFVRPYMKAWAKQQKNLGKEIPKNALNVGA